MPNVLLIDDDVENRKGTARLFVGKGWEVIEADDGDHGIDLAFKHRPKLIVCDLLLPKLSGLQVCREIRENLNSVKIIVTAGRHYNVDREAVLDSGADEYLIKPLRWQRLSAVVKRRPRRQG